jgi:hypothetical protein
MCVFDGLKYRLKKVVKKDALLRSANIKKKDFKRWITKNLFLHMRTGIKTHDFNPLFYNAAPSQISYHVYVLFPFLSIYVFSFPSFILSFFLSFFLSFPVIFVCLLLQNQQHLFVLYHLKKWSIK